MSRGDGDLRRYLSKFKYQFKSRWSVARFADTVLFKKKRRMTGMHN